MATPLLRGGMPRLIFRVRVPGAAIGLPSAWRRSLKTLSIEGQMQLLSAPLSKADPTVFDIIEREKQRQKSSINLIPSENFTSQAVLEALGSVMQNKYSEGYPGTRYYGGNEVIDQAERLCQQRALEAFGLEPESWGVNVQALSGSPANLYVYSALLRPHDRLMSLDLPHGGHLSHGYQTATKKISAVSKYFETLPYRVDEKTGYIDYDRLEQTAVLYRPRLIVAGATAYSRLIDYRRIRDICDRVGAYLLADIAHLAGMVAAKVMPGPFAFADVVTTTTHKTLRGPRGALIFYRRGPRAPRGKAGGSSGSGSSGGSGSGGSSSGGSNSSSKPHHAKTRQPDTYDLEGPICASVFPGHQGGPHNHTITAIAVALRQTTSPEFHAYQAQILDNAQALARRLGDPKDKGGLGYSIVAGGTDNHLMVVDLRPQGVDGARVERVLELVGVAANKNTVPGDRSALVPGGLRMGTPAMTTRGFREDDFVRVADIVDRAVAIAVRVDKAARRAAEDKDKDTNPARLSVFLDYLADGENDSEIVQLRSEVADWVTTYPLPWDSAPHHHHH